MNEIPNTEFFRVINHRLYRQHTTNFRDGGLGDYMVKDLKKLGRDLAKTIIIDDIRNNFAFTSPNNGLVVSMWEGDAKDRQLELLTPMLIDIVKKGVDVRRILTPSFQDYVLTRYLKPGKKFPELDDTFVALGQGKIELLWSQTQLELSERLVRADEFEGDLTTDNLETGLKLIASVDIKYEKLEELGVASLIVCEYPKMNVVYEDYTLEQPSELPYIRGYFAFKQIPIYEVLFQKLNRSHPELWPQVLLVNGNGIMHTRAFGMASHIGLHFDIPTIGICKRTF